MLKCTQSKPRLPGAVGNRGSLKKADDRTMAIIPEDWAEFKKLERKLMKLDAKLHWAIVAAGSAAALTALVVACRAQDIATKQGAVAASLVSFGIAYNRLVTWLKHQDWEEGATAILVIGGTLYTIMLISVLIGHFTTMLGCFAASGAPMAVGSWLRYVMRRSRERQEARNRALKGLGDDESA